MTTTGIATETVGGTYSKARAEGTMYISLYLHLVNKSRYLLVYLLPEASTTAYVEPPTRPDHADPAV